LRFGTQTQRTAGKGRLQPTARFGPVVPLR